MCPFEKVYHNGRAYFIYVDLCVSEKVSYIRAVACLDANKTRDTL